MGKVSDSGKPPAYLSTDTSRPSPADQIRFIASIERVLAEGSFVATYKYALHHMLALPDDSKSGLLQRTNRRKMRHARQFRHGTALDQAT